MITNVTNVTNVTDEAHLENHTRPVSPHGTGP